MIKKNKLINDFDLSSQIYFNEISQFKPLSFEEEVSLWKRYKQNNDLKAKEKIIKSNLKFVASVARGYQGRGLSYSDLIAEGNCGLLRALEKFDYKKGYKTISYSVWWIKQAILEALKERNGLNCEELPMDYEKQYNDTEDSNDLPNNTVINNFIDEEDTRIASEELKNTIIFLINTLSEREKIIITEYYGINGEAKTLEEIGEKLNLTKERVRQIKEGILKKLRTTALTNFITTDIYK